MTAKIDHIGPEGPGLEHTLKQLETLIEEMESSETNLEESLKAFEHGVELTHRAQSLLSDAEQKVQILMTKNGEIVSRAFVADENEK